MTKNELSLAFSDRYGQKPRLFYAPGRINLIGEHTDYNNGFVLPFPINCGVTIAAAPRADRQLRIYSMHLDEAGCIDLDLPEQRQRGTWLDYVEGVARSLERRSVPVHGANLLVWSTVSPGSGLASSAALEIALATALNLLSGETMDGMSMVLAAQEAEHLYVGTRSGIMDQYVVTFGEADSCLLIDCRSLESWPVPLPTKDVALIVCDTGIKHRLASSEYNRRRAECEGGVRQIQRYCPNIRSLRDVGLSDFQRIESSLSNPVRARCRHVITEIARTLEAADALKDGDVQRLGRLIYDSHRSLRVDYEVSCPELDVLVEATRTVDGALGARMTGGGFGGCTINLVRRNALHRFHQNIQRDYRKAIGSDPSIFEVFPGEGKREIDPDHAD